jgi:DNA-binding transcriptional LysR family regulator
MDIKGIDLNLLVVFEAMTQHRSVTRAAEAIGLSQPAMSAAVGRLRVLFVDPLFVRSGAEMKPTARAAELADPVRRALDTVRNDILRRPGFDPATVQATFTIITPDIGEVNFLPSLLERFEHEAPQARLRAISRPRQAAAQALESGEGNVAVGYFPDLAQAGFLHQKLFDNPHVCIVRRDHPQIGRRVSLKQYLRASHAVVAPDGREHVFEQFLRKRGLQRTVRLELSHFMSLLPVIENSDLIATVPRDLADVCTRYSQVRLVEVPIKAPVIAVHQYWHRRSHQDAANVWLRSLIRSLHGRSR